MEQQFNNLTEGTKVREAWQHVSRSRQMAPNLLWLNFVTWE